MTTEHYKTLTSIYFNDIIECYLKVHAIASDPGLSLAEQHRINKVLNGLDDIQADIAAALKAASITNQAITNA